MNDAEDNELGSHLLMHFEDAIKLLLSVLVFTAPQGMGDLLERVDKRTSTIVCGIDLQDPGCQCL